VKKLNEIENVTVIKEINKWLWIQFGKLHQYCIMCSESWLDYLSSLEQVLC